MSSSEEDGVTSGNFDDQDHTEDQDKYNLSQVLRREVVMLGIKPEGITTPSKNLKSASVASQNKNSPVTLISSLESCYYRESRLAIAG